MSTIVKFISETKLKELSGINGNTDNALLQPIIVDVQRLYIERIVGTSLYNQLITQVEASTVTVLNATLLDDYIIPCLVAYVKSECTLYLNYKFTNKNVAKKSSDNSEPNTLEETKFLLEQLKNNAEYHAERVTKYLLENSTSYPLYDNAGNGVDTVHPNGTNYTAGIYLGDSFKDWGDTCRNCGKIYLG